MLVVLLCCMMKLVEFSTGRSRRRKPRKSRAKAMNELGNLGIRGIPVSPDSDCNSNHHGSSSYLSNTSSQDVDFVQDISDYQWFLDYGYREGGVNHQSILSLPESYEVNDVTYYDALAKNMDANLAEADMESFRTEDIHTLLTNLPPMCTDHLSQENNRQGESFASVSGSLMAKFELDSSGSGDDSANSASLYKSELLFSPVKDVPMPGANFSVDSLDCDMMLTCQANKDNYTIAFEGSALYSEDSDYTDKSENSATHWSNAAVPKQSNKPMTQSDSGGFTTWSKLKKRSSDNQLRRHPSGNNNNNSTGEETAHLGLSESSVKSQSMPNLHKQRLKSLLVTTYVKNQNACASEKKPVKVFDIQHQNSSANLSDMATSVDAISTSENNGNGTKAAANFSLVKLFMKQKSMSIEGMSTTMDQLSSSENWPHDEAIVDSKPELKSSFDQRIELIAEEPEEEASRSESVEQLSESASLENEHFNNNNNSFSSDPCKKHNKEITINRSMQTSHFSEILNLKSVVHKTARKSNNYKVVEPSFLDKLKNEGEIQKPVYVLYPNYVLPNLDFLSNESNVLLIPQEAPNAKSALKKRPFSCNDVEMLKKKGFGHVKDWDSLHFLLPQEYRKILADVPELSVLKRERPRAKRCDVQASSCSSGTQPSSGFRGSSTILSDSQCSPAPTATWNPMFVYRYDSVTSSEASLMTSNRSITTAPPLPTRCVSLQDAIPPRPPLPRSILRRDKNGAKRYSLYETSEEDLTEDAPCKRRSLQEQYFSRKQRPYRFSETEDEGVDAGTSSSSVDENHDSLRTASPSNLNKNFLLSTDELVQLEEFLKISGISTSDNEELNEESLTQLRSYVAKFLALKINQEGAEHFGGKKSVSFAEKIKIKNMEGRQFLAPNNSPNVSAFVQQRHLQPKTLADLPISESDECTPHASPQTTPLHKSSCNLEEKRALVSAVSDAVEQLVRHFSSAANQTELNMFGDSTINPSCAKLVLSTLSPALYAVLSDGLKPSLESSFGAINNSVWQVVEAAAQQGPLTKALNELVMRVNSEDAIVEGLVKFNAFVFGLLNVRSLDAWLSYLRTRESILKKHYGKDSLFVLAHTAQNVRTLLDGLIAALQPLALLPFQIDLFFECRQLHLSFKRMDTYQQQLSPTQHWTFPKLHSSNSDSEDNSAMTVKPAESETLTSSPTKHKERPRSCVDAGVSRPNFKLGDVTSAAKKRWSGISVNSKLYLAYDRLGKEEEEYVDSLENANNEPESIDSQDKPLNGKRFKKLQQKWEMLSGRESNQSPPASPTNRSKIPRPVTSPMKPSGIPVLISPSRLAKKSFASNNVEANAVKPNKKQTPVARTSRMDQNETPKHNIPRPSSLPYKTATPPNGKLSKVAPPRRAASSSLNRKTPNKSVPKVVRTLSHRVPSESGHLSYNEGDRLKVVLEVDDKWLLCCRGSQKGLVPKAAVIALEGRF